ncbi:MAG TPA: SRPBCC family protein [Micromonosporaceae bacterium]
MTVVERVIAVPPQRVFAVLADGWSYSDWVVGTAHIRDVDDHWPDPGACIHHQAGPWPLSLQDKTSVLVCEPPHHLVLLAELRPLGVMTVTFTLTPLGTGGTRVTMGEEMTGGLLRWARNRVNHLVLHYRNREALRRLADLAMRRYRDPMVTSAAASRNKMVNK